MDPSPAADAIPLIAGFTILREIGRGGFGVVYQARQASLDRLVAIKVLSEQPDDHDERVVARFAREAKVAARLNHPHIVQAIDFGRDAASGRWYYAMELVEGPTLRALVERAGPLDERRALRIAAAIASALAHAHAAGVVHRDIKPENIFLTDAGVAKLGDLGLARALSAAVAGARPRLEVSMDGGVVGTPLYMAPEQIHGPPDAVDGRADFYSLGATLYHLVTGRPPFAGDSPIEILSAHLKQAPTDPRAHNRALGKPFAEFVLRLLAKSPDDRPADAAALTAAIVDLRRAKVLSARGAPGRIARAGAATAAPTTSRGTRPPRPAVARSVRPVSATVATAPLPVVTAADEDAALLAELDAATGRGVVDASAEGRARWAAVGAWRALPRAVARPRDADEAAAIVAVCARRRLPVVLRGGGTALDGEAVGDGVLIVARELRRMRRAEDGDVICGAGVGATLVDAALAAEGSCLGDDGADLMAARGPATIGGLIAGGARGLEVVALDLILADGLRLDTGADDADERLAGSRPGLVSELIALRTAARGDAMLCRRIREAAALGNGLGYRLDALIDGATPVAILHRLVIGSQGTLACIAGARLRPRRRAADRGATAWLAFAGVAAAVVAARALADAGAQRAEVFDAAALRLLGEPAPGDAGAGARLLVDWREDADAALDQRLLLAAQIVAGSILEPFAITRAPAQRRRRRQARLRLAALAGAAGAPPVVHDLALPPDRLRDAALRVRAVLDRHGWRDAPMTIGHAGSLRALVALDHGDAAARARHRAARDEIAAIVLAAGGCLAGADGTGRERADLVERQWGTEGLAFMRRVKRALDAHAILGPGVVVPDERAAAAIAPAPALPVSPAIDACTACGACEGACAPVADGLRARIARLRAMRWGTAEQRLASAQACGADRIDVRLRRAIAAGPCPLGIDDAAVAAVEHPAPPPRWRRRLADVARRNLAGIGRIAAVASGFALRLGDGRVPRIGLVLTPPAIGARRAPPPARGATVVVHVPSCVATATGSRVGDAIAAWCARSGHAPHPTTVTGLCCGGAFAVAGCADAAAAAGARCAATLRRMRDELPVGTLFVTDRASCAARVAASGFPLMVPPPRARFAAAGIPHMAPSEDDEAR